MQREQMHYDVVIVGAGPAGLTAAIRIKQLCRAHEDDISVCLLEKGACIGAHTLSGAIFDARALTELIPDWRQLSAPITTKVITDQFYYLTSKRAWKLPTPPQQRNKNNFIISLGKLCSWLAEQATNLGVDIFPNFAANEVLFDTDKKRVIGVATGDMGINKQGEQTDKYQPGIELHAKQTLFAEGCRGHLSQFIQKHFNLNRYAQPQTYGIGLKELWQIDPNIHQQGLVMHSVGWPLDNKTYGGSFIYHAEEDQLAVGFVVGLDYQNPYLNPFEELQRLKTHPKFKPYFTSGQRIKYGARALVEGGLQALPELSFPGGMLIGDSAGFLNVPRLKGNHTAMKSAIVAAECLVAAINNDLLDQPVNYQQILQSTWLWKELNEAKNIRPGFYNGLIPGLLYAALDTYLLKGKAPWTFKTHHDHNQLMKHSQAVKIQYPKPDGKITFDKLSSVYLSNTHHEADQPCHLTLIDSTIPIKTNHNEYDAPETRYCPAAVYEIVKDAQQKPKLQINAQNCIHCKTCDIKDPKQNIKWVSPEGGGGPNYLEM